MLPGRRNGRSCTGKGSLAGAPRCTGWIAAPVPRSIAAATRRNHILLALAALAIAWAQVVAGLTAEGCRSGRTGRSRKPLAPVPRRIRRVPFRQDFRRFSGVAQSRYPASSRPVPAELGGKSGGRSEQHCRSAVRSPCRGAAQATGIIVALHRRDSRYRCSTLRYASRRASTGRSGRAPNSTMAFGASVPRRLSAGGPPAAATRASRKKSPRGPTSPARGQS